MELHLKNTFSDFRKNFITYVPVLIFFPLLFFTIVFFFGTQYALVITFITTAFKFRFRKKQTVRSLLSLFLVQMALSVLAFFAALNLFLCILLNIIVPFILIYLQTTQFNQQGYLTNAMLFVFLQLVSVDWSKFLPMMGVMAYASLFLVAGLAIYYVLFRRKQPNYMQACKGLGILAREFEMMADGRCDLSMKKDMVMLHTSLNRMAYTSRDLSYVVRGEGKVHYMFALLFQRSVYFMNDFSQSQQRCVPDVQRLHILAAFLENVQQNMSTTDNSKLIATANTLAEETDGLSERFAVFMRNFMHLLALTLQAMQQDDSRPDWKLPAHAHPLYGLKRRLRLDTFEVRFALRLSLVSTISFAVCRITQSDHAYWLPINAFILLQPMSEESAYRMKTRSIGTLIGCAVSFAVLPLLPVGLFGHMLFAAAMLTLMYVFFRPGTWEHAASATCFALSLASITMSGQSAIELRLFYFALAVALVFIVNRFFFPTSKKGQFKNNMKELFHIQHSYLSMLQISTRRLIDYGVVSDALISFHMFYDEVRKYLKAPSVPMDTAPYEKMLPVMWRMTAETEQLIFYVQNEQLSPAERAEIERFSVRMGDLLNGLCGIQAPPRASGKHLTASSPYASHLMQHYQSNFAVLSGLQNEILSL